MMSPVFLSVLISSLHCGGKFFALWGKIRKWENRSNKNSTWQFFLFFGHFHFNTFQIFRDCIPIRFFGCISKPKPTSINSRISQKPTKHKQWHKRPKMQKIKKNNKIKTKTETLTWNLYNIHRSGFWPQWVMFWS